MPDCRHCGKPLLNENPRRRVHKKCSREWTRLQASAWYKKHKSDPSFRKQRSDYAKEYRKGNPEKRLLLGAKQRAKERGLPFNLEVEDVSIPKECPVFKVPFEVNTAYAPSLDRIKPERGYTKGNIQVISRKANLMKQDATEQELKDFSEWVRKTFQI